jgi:hypothetical protein
MFTALGPGSAINSECPLHIPLLGFNRTLETTFLLTCHETNDTRRAHNYAVVEDILFLHLLSRIMNRPMTSNVPYFY